VTTLMSEPAVEHSPTDVPDDDRCEMVDLFRVVEGNDVGVRAYMKFVDCPNRAEWVIETLCEICTDGEQYTSKRICDHHRDLSEAKPTLGRDSYGHTVVVLAVRPLGGGGL
jgi:hypothetical protein